MTATRIRRRNLGHESIKTTSDTYVHVELDAIGDEMRMLLGDAV